MTFKANVNSRIVRARWLNPEEVVNDYCIIDVVGNGKWLPATSSVFRDLNVMEHSAGYISQLPMFLSSKFAEVTSQSYRDEIDEAKQLAVIKGIHTEGSHTFDKPFPANVLAKYAASDDWNVMKLVPIFNLIPVDADELKPWIEWQRTWFFKGMTGGIPNVKDGIDRTDAWTHLNLVQRDFDIPHEYKQVAVAFLASKWLYVHPTVLVTSNERT